MEDCEVWRLNYELLPPQTLTENWAMKKVETRELLIIIAGSSRPRVVYEQQTLFRLRPTRQLQCKSIPAKINQARRESRRYSLQYGTTVPVKLISHIFVKRLFSSVDTCSLVNFKHSIDLIFHKHHISVRSSAISKKLHNATPWKLKRNEWFGFYKHYSLFKIWMILVKFPTMLNNQTT